MISGRNIAIFILLTCLLSYSELLAGPSAEEEINNILTSAESLFKAMQERQYKGIWQLITIKTRKSIVDAIYRELKKSGSGTLKENIEVDCQNGDALSRAYWDAYLSVFDPEMVLQNSKWSVGRIENSQAEINILFKKSANPAILKLFKENNSWKVGINETFGARTLLPFN
jgi:hypothetical protein